MLYTWYHVSLRVLLGGLLSLLLPAPILEVGSSLLIEGSVKVGGVHHRKDFFEHFGKSFCGGPLVTCLDHIVAYHTLLINVGMVDGCLESDDGSLEGEVIELELKSKLPSLERGVLGSCDGDFPEVGSLLLNNEALLLDVSLFGGNPLSHLLIIIPITTHDHL